MAKIFNDLPTGRDRAQETEVEWLRRRVEELEKRLADIADGATPHIQYVPRYIPTTPPTSSDPTPPFTITCGSNG